MVDAITIGALGDEIVRPPFLVYLDIDGDQVRATTWESAILMTDTGDPDLDGHSFGAVDPTFARLSPVKRATGGSDTVTAELSGIVGPNSDLLDLLGDEKKWKGRVARAWFLVLDDQGRRIGAVVPYYTGRMVGFGISGRATDQTAKITIENYLATLTSASNRTYMSQAEFDPLDTSAELTLATANGAKQGPASSIDTTNIERARATMLGQAYR